MRLYLTYVHDCYNRKELKVIKNDKQILRRIFNFLY